MGTATHHFIKTANTFWKNCSQIIKRCISQSSRMVNVKMHAKL